MILKLVLSESYSIPIDEFEHTIFSISLMLLFSSCFEISNKFIFFSLKFTDTKESPIFII
jgi:hypothetical protein